MPRDSILEEAKNAEQEQTDDHDTDDVSEDVEQTGNDQEGGSDRVKLTQRMPSDLLDEVDRVQEELALPSRNATINFLVKRAVKDV